MKSSYRQGFEEGLAAVSQYLDNDQRPPFPPPLERVPKGVDYDNWLQGWRDGWFWFAGYETLGDSDERD